MQRVTSNKKAALLAGAALAGSSLLSSAAHASLVVSFAFTDGSTSRALTAADVGTNIPINIFATVTGQNAIVSQSNDDGLQYLYYSIVSQIPSGQTAIGGALVTPAATSLSKGAGANAGINWRGSGSQVGTLQDLNGDGLLDIGGTGNNNTAYAKPRSAGATWDDSGVSPLVNVNGKSVSFLVQTVQYHVNSLTGTQTKFNPVPAGTNVLGSGVASANWWEDNQGSAANGPEDPTVGTSNTSATAGAGVLFTASAVVTNKIVSLTAASANTVYGTKLGPITVVGSNGNYQPAFQHTINAATDTVEVNGFNPGSTDPEIYALKLSGSPNIANLIADINGNNTGVTAQVPSADIAALFPGYQIELVAAAGSRSADQNLAFDFTQAPAADLNGAVVTDVAAVPEPATAAGILLGSAGMLLGRRRRNA